MCGGFGESERERKRVVLRGRLWNRLPKPMSEFKFACPVCGQHITADSSTSGGQLECPTCFRKIVVPQAPTAGDSKFIISAAQVAKPRPASATSTSLPPPSAS